MTGDDVPAGRRFEETSLSLLIRARNSDPAAWARLVRLYSPLICYWCRQYGLKNEDMADVGQEVFAAVARSIGQFEYGKKGSSFRGWLKTITRNKVRDLFRKAPCTEGDGGSDALARLLAIPEARDEEEQSDSATDERILLRQASEMVLAEFEEQTRQAFLKVVIDQEDPAEVAKQLGISVNSVYLAKSRICRRLKAEFSDLLESLKDLPRPDKDDAHAGPAAN